MQRQKITFHIFSVFGRLSLYWLIETYRKKVLVGQFWMFTSLIRASSCTVLWLAAWPLWAALVIEGGTHFLSPGVQVRVPIMVSGGDLAAGLNLWVQIGDGGTANGGSLTAPIITAVDIVGPGTVFNSSNTGQYAFQSGGLMWGASTTTNPPANAASVPATGTLAYITINTTGAATGSYPLRLQGVASSVFPPSGKATELLAPPGAPPSPPTPLPVTVYDGSLIIARPLTWNKAGDGNWTEAQWTGSPPSYPDSSVAAVINTPRIVTVDAARQANWLEVSGGGRVLLTSSGTLALPSGLSLSTGGSTVVASGASLTVGTYTFNGGTLSGTGTIHGSTVTTPNAADTLTLQGVTGGALIKAGSGTLVLDTANTYTGGTTVTGGKLQVAALDALPAGKSLTIGAGASVVLQSGLGSPAVHTMTWNKPGDGNWSESVWTGSPPSFPDNSADAVIATPYTVTVDAARQAHSVNISGGGKLSLTFARSLALTTTATIGTGGTLALVPGATITGSGMTLSGGTLALSGSGTVSPPAITVSSGTVSTSTSTDNVTLHSPLSGAGQLTKAGAGTLVLDMANTYSGGTLVSGGTLRIAHLNSLPTGGNLIIQAGGTLVLASGLSGAAASQAGAAVSATPEPGTLALLAAAGLVSIAAWLRRRAIW